VKVPSKPGSAIYLPLATSVEMFSDPAQPAALVRAKQAAVLHERLFVEMGYLDVSVTEHGGSRFWTPPDDITEDQIARARNPAPVGSPMSMSVGVQPAPGEPATEMRTVVAGSLTASYGAEWQSEVLGPLQALGVDWVEAIAIGGRDIPGTDPIGEEIAQLNWHASRDDSLLRDVNTFKRDFIYGSFNRDAVIAGELGAVLQITTLFEPMVTRASFAPQPSGQAALEVVAPNVGALEWGEIAEFRAHPGAAEARALMFEFDRRAMEQEPRDATDYLLKVGQQVTDGLMAAVRERSTKIASATREEIARLPVAFIPHVGPLIDKAITGIQLRTRAKREERSVVAALMKLRRE
jgi:hypothetical protein